MPITREIPVPHHELAIADDYARSLGALVDLGWTEPEAAGVPSLEAVTAGIDQVTNLSAWLIARADEGANDQLVISHTIGGKHGVGVASTIARFDPAAHTDGYVWSPLWGHADGSSNPYKGGDTGVVHDNAGNKGLTSAWDVGILLGDATDPATDKPAYAEGLVYTGKTVGQQRDALKAEQANLKRQNGIEIVSANVGQIVADAAGLRLNGQAQRPGVTRLIHYPNKKVVDFGRVPFVYQDDGRLDFVRSNVDFDWDDVGARRLVRVPLPSLEV